MCADGEACTPIEPRADLDGHRRQLAATEEPPPLLHPEMARIYRTKVNALASIRAVAEHARQRLSEGSLPLRDTRRRTESGEVVPVSCY